MLLRPKRFIREHTPFFVVAIISAILLFSNLGNIYLWQDEAETACIARNVLKFGLPIAWDGVNLVNQVNIIEWNDDFIWTWHPWGMFYLVALSYWAFGITAVAARFPFALAGLLSIASLYFIAHRWTRDRLTALLAAVILAANLQFILHCRQCRYYALIPLTTVFIVWGYWNLRKRSGFITFVLASILLFHSCYIPFFPTLLAIALFHFGRIAVGYLKAPDGVIERKVAEQGADAHPLQEENDAKQTQYRADVKAEIARFAAALALIAVFTAPWFFYAINWDFAGEIRGGDFGVNFLGCLGEANRSLIPLALFFAAVAWLCKGARKGMEWGLNWETCYFLLFIIGLNLVFIPLVAPIEPDLYFRYMVGLCPLVAMVLAVMFRYAIGKHVMLGSALLFIYFATTLLEFVGDVPIALLQQHTNRSGFERALQQLRDDAKSYFVGISASPDRSGRGKIPSYYDFLCEVTHDYDGPNEGIVKFLKQHASPGDYVFTSYGVPSLIFHCNYADDGLGARSLRATDATVAGASSSNPRSPADDHTGRSAQNGGNEVDKGNPESEWIRLAVVAQTELLSERHLKTLPAYTYSLRGVKEFWYVPRQVWGEWAKQFIRDLARDREITYDKFVIPYPNIPWGNRPDRAYHKFRTVADRKGMMIYRVKIGRKRQSR